MGIDGEVDFGSHVRKDALQDLCFYIRNTYEMTLLKVPPATGVTKEDLDKIFTVDYHDDFEEWLHTILDKRHK